MKKLKVLLLTALLALVMVTGAAYAQDDGSSTDTDVPDTIIWDIDGPSVSNDNGNPTRTPDDVIVDGRIITAE